MKIGPLKDQENFLISQHNDQLSFCVGFLKKQRKEGKKFIGSKYQKRYCVLRNHVLYYFKDKKSPKQQGSILLPGYEAKTANKKGQEFTLTHPDGHRSYQVLILLIDLVTRCSTYLVFTMYFVDAVLMFEMFKLQG